MSTTRPQRPELPTDGDVQIHIHSGRVLNLESKVLRRHCPKLANDLHEVRAAPLSDAAISHGNTTLYRLELQLPTFRTMGALEPGHLHSVALDENGRPGAGEHTNVIVLNPNSRAGHPIFDAWVNVFRAMYHSDLENLDVSSPEAVLHAVIAMMKVAEYLECMHMLVAPVESAFWAHQQFIQEAMSNAPITWLATAARLRSANLFGASLIHVVGQYNAISEDELSQLDDDTRKIVEKKATQLGHKKALVEQNVVAYVPKELQKAPSEKTMRQDYADDIFRWQAYSIWQHWMNGQFVVERGRNGFDGGYALYRQVLDREYLSEDDLLRTWFEFCPMSVRAQRVIHRRLDELKERAMSVIAELFEEESLLAQGTYPLRYLTCIPFDSRNDVPWETEGGSQGSA